MAVGVERLRLDDVGRRLAPGGDACELIAEARAMVAGPGGMVAATAVLPCSGVSLPPPVRLTVLEERYGVSIGVFDKGSALTRASVRMTRRGGRGTWLARRAACLARLTKDDERHGHVTRRSRSW